MGISPSILKKNFLEKNLQFLIRTFLKLELLELTFDRCVIGLKVEFAWTGVILYTLYSTVNILISIHYTCSYSLYKMKFS